MKRNNLVHKHSMKFNRAVTHRDKKKDSKRNYKVKHKKDYRKDNPFSLNIVKEVA